MVNAAGLALMIGVGQVVFQAYLLVENGYWSHFTIGDLLADLGLVPRYIPVMWGERLVEWLLDRELSFALMACGGTLILWRPLGRALDASRAGRDLRQLRREHAMVGDRRSPPDADPELPAR